MKILVADDHRMIRQLVRALLEKQRDVTVVAEAANGREAVRLAKEHCPDVLIMDVSMPEMNGIDATRRLSEECPTTKVLALSTTLDADFIRDMLDAGAVGYLLKDCASLDLEQAVRSVFCNETYLSPAAAAALGAPHQRGSPRPPQPLSLREREILQLLTEGKSTRQVADLLHVSPKTVETHRQHIMKKLGVRNLPELTRYALRQGLTTLDG
jgi:two-component system, NarL family, response regulator NreC